MIDRFGEWGQRWARAHIGADDLDAGLLMWDIHRRVDVGALPPERVVVRFDFRGAPATMRCPRTWWLLVARSEVDLCLKDPGFPVDVVVTADLRTLTRVWMGDVPMAAALHARSIRLEGPPSLVRAFPAWLQLSSFARVERARHHGRRAVIMAGEETSRADTWLVDVRPTARQSGSAAAVAALALVGFIAAAPFAGRPLPALNALFPSLDAIVFVTDLVTAVLLFAQYSISRSRSLFALATGYLFTAFIVVPHALTFAGAFTPAGLLGAGIQTGSWLFIFWHIGFAAGLLAYAGLREANARHPSRRRRPCQPSAGAWRVCLPWCSA